MESTKIDFNTITINEVKKLDFSDSKIITQFGFTNIPTENSYLSYVNASKDPNDTSAKLLLENTFRIGAVLGAVEIQQKMFSEFTFGMSPIPMTICHNFHKQYMKNCSKILNSDTHSGFLFHNGFDEFFSIDKSYDNKNNILSEINKLLLVTIGMRCILNIFSEKYSLWEKEIEK